MKQTLASAPTPGPAELRAPSTYTLLALFGNQVGRLRGREASGGQPRGSPPVWRAALTAAPRSRRASRSRRRACAARGSTAPCSRCSRGSAARAGSGRGSRTGNSPGHNKRGLQMQRLVETRRLAHLRAPPGGAGAPEVLVQVDPDVGDPARPVAHVDRREVLHEVVVLHPANGGFAQRETTGRMNGPRRGAGGARRTRTARRP